MKIIISLLLSTMSFASLAQTADVQRGALVFQEQCVRCHIPIEIEARLRNDWYGHNGAELLQRISTTMPGETPGSLSQQQYRDVTAFVLRIGRSALPSQTLALEELSTLLIQADTSLQSGESVGNTQWDSFNGDTQSSRYSSLSQISPENVSELEVAWRWSSANIGPITEGQSPTSPLMVNGILYVTAGVTRNVVALDPESGQMLWLWRPQEGTRFDVAPRKGSGKGLAYWNDGAKEIIFTVTPGYYLVALNAKTGLPVEDFGAGGWVDLQEGLRLGPGREDLDIGLSFPPLVVDDVVIVGASHALAIRPPHAENVKGDIRAFDANTGELLWTFHTIPEANEFGSETWLGNSAEYTGNAGVWAPMSADPELGLVYLPVEAATGDFYGGDRPGNNLFSSSLVAVDYRTGEMRWYFQLVHHDIWDWDTPTAPILADLPDGKKVVVQLTKQGMAYVFDRETGETIWDIIETPVPQTDVPGEYTSLTQAIPVLPPPFVRQGMNEEELLDFTPELNAKAREIASQYRLGEFFTPPSLADAPDGTIGTLALPNAIGGANWPGGAFDPESGILYVPSREAVSLMSLVPGGDDSTVRYIQGQFGNPTVDGLPLIKPPWGRITAIDLNTGEELWWIPNAATPDYVTEHPALEGVELSATGIPNPVGLLATQTLLFAGEGNAGKPIFRAYDKRTGETVAEIALPATQTGLPMTYMLNNKQYIVMAVSGGGRSEIVALALP